MNLRKKWLLTLMLVMTFLVGVVSADDHSIAEIAGSSEDFTVLSAAIEAAGLTDMLDNRGPFTVFAPTDDAFAKIPSADLEAIVADTGLLRQILLYHVVQGEVPASEVVNMTSAQTALGKYISIQADENGVMINGSSNVIAVDVMAENGIIHVIDTVLLPPEGWGPEATQPPAAPPPTEGGDDNSGEPAPSAPPAMDDAEGMLADAIAKARFILEQMGGVLDRSNFGDAIACDEFNGYYSGLMALPTYDELSPSVEGIHAKYREAVDLALETNLSISEGCADGGTQSASRLNFGVARTGVNDALNILLGLQDLVGEGSGGDTPADPPPADESPVEEPPADAPEEDASDAPEEDTPAPAPSGIGADLLSAMEEARVTIEGMGWILDQSSGGSSIDCGQFLMMYDKLKALPTYTNEQLPAEIEGIHAQYRAAVDKALETNEAIYLGCDGGGTKSASPLNFGVARQGINEALNILIPAIEAAGPIIANLSPSDAPAPPPADDEPEMPETADPAPDSPMTHPVDRDGDGNITYDDYLILGEEHAGRADIYFETGQPVPWDAESFYLDTTFMSFFVEVHLYPDPGLDGMTFADLVREDPEGTCFLYSIYMITIIFTPEYSGVPGEWSEIYNAYRQTVADVEAATTPFIDACFEGVEIPDNTIDQALNGLPEFINRFNTAERSGAEMLGVESFTDMGGWMDIIIAFIDEQNNNSLSYAYNVPLQTILDNYSLFE